MTAHALVFVASPDDKPAYREALLMLGRVALIAETAAAGGAQRLGERAVDL